MGKDYRHYRVLSKQLARHVDPETREAILSGMDYVGNSSKPEVKAAWAREMMRRMDTLLDPETCIRVHEACACVSSDRNSIYARTFLKLRKAHLDEDSYLDAVVEYLNSTSPLRRCGEVMRQGDRILSVIGRVRREGSALRDGLDAPLSVTWCHCCKGSLLGVYEPVFPDRRCHMEIVSTFASGGNECSFVTTYGEAVGA